MTFIKMKSAFFLANSKYFKAFIRFKVYNNYRQQVIYLLISRKVDNLIYLQQISRNRNAKFPIKNCEDNDYKSAEL